MYRISRVFVFLLAVLPPFQVLAQEVEAPPAAARSERLTFTLLDILATDYETSLEAVAREEERGLVSLMTDATRATERGDTGAALSALEAVAGRRPGDAVAWMQLAQMWADHRSGDARGLAAAYMAYLRAGPGEEATRALLGLGDAAFARRDALQEEADRAARTAVNDEESARLNAMDGEADGMLAIARLIQSEIGRTLTRSDEIARQGERPDATPGFYLSGNEPRGVEWRGSVPETEVCVFFTRPLRADATMVAGAITLKLADVDGAETGLPLPVRPSDITVVESRVCLHGLAVDTAYVLRFDKTLRSAGGARLPLDPAAPGGVEQAWAATGFRTAAPEPRVGFEGDDYVLRAGGYATLGAVNTRSATLSLYRIADRSLARNVALGHVGKGLDSRELTAFGDGVAERVWSGTVDFDAEPNRRALAQVPLDAILDARALAIADAQASREVFGGMVQVDPAREGVPGLGLFALVIEEAEDTGGEKRRFFTPTSRTDSMSRTDAIPTQWFVRTDTGLSFYESADFLHVAARDLGTGGARPGTLVELISASNRVLASASTDARGIATFRRSLTKGTGALRMRMAVAYAGRDFVFLPADTPPLQLDGLGLARRDLDTRRDLYLTPERGVYRPGETIRAVAILRGPTGGAVAAPPQVSLRLEADDGPVGAVTMLAPDEWQAGGRDVSIPVPASASAGSARLVAREGIDGPVIGRAPVVIGFFRPDTVRVEAEGDAAFEASVTGSGDARVLRIEGGVRASYLYGVPLAERGDLPEAPANGLSGTVWARLVSDGIHDPACYPGFRFGDTARETPATLRRAATIRETGQDAAPGEEGGGGQGYLRIMADFLDPPLDRAPLRADVTVQLDDGAANQGRTTPAIPVTIPRTAPMIGLRATDGRLQALVLDPEDRAREGDIYYRLETEEITYIWQRDAGAWKAQATAKLATLGMSYDGDLVYRDGAPVPVDEDSPEAGFGAFEYAPRGADAAGCLMPGEMLDISALPPGRYVVTAALDAGFSGGGESALATYRFEVGQAEGPAPERPETFSLRLEQEDVAVGEEIVAHVEALSIRKGHVLVAAVKEGRILAWRDTEIGADGTVPPIRFDTTPGAGRDWRGGVHLFATAFRAQGEGRAPSAARAVAATHARVAGSRRGFDVTVLSPDPRSRVQTIPGDEALTVKIRAEALAPDERAYAAIGLVDDGLWRLTGFAPRDPDAHFFAKRSLAMTVRDLYGRMLDSVSMRGAGGSGGDDVPGMAASGLLVGNLLSALETVEFVDGIAETSFDLDGFVGSANLFVIAWSDGGSAEKAAPRTGFARATYAIRSDAVVSLVAPERLSPGDKAVARLIVRRPRDDPRMSAALRLRMRVGKPGARSSAQETRIDREIVLAEGEWRGDIALDATPLGSGGDGPLFLPIRLELYDPASPRDPIARKEWTVSVGPPAGESVEFFAALGIAEPGGELAVDLPRGEAQEAVTLQEIVLNPLAPTLAATQVAWEAPRDFPAAAADAVFGIADLIARRTPRSPDGGLGALIALRGEARAVPDPAMQGSAPRMYMDEIWQAASALDIALVLRELEAMDDTTVIDVGVGELTRSLRRYDVPDFCRSESYFAVIALARAGDLDPSLPVKLEQCIEESGADAFDTGLLAAALSAAGVNGADGVVTDALALFAESPPERARDGALAAAMIVENGVDLERAAQFVRVALPSPEGRERLGREAAAWMARTQARLGALFEPVPLDPAALALVPRGLDTRAMEDGTVRIDLAARGAPERFAFGNGTDRPIHAMGRYRLSPGDLTEGGGAFGVTTRLLRDTENGPEETTALRVREGGVFMVEVMAEAHDRLRAIVHVPPGMELAEIMPDGRLAGTLDLTGAVGEVIREPGRVVLELEADSAGAIRAAFAVTPVLEGDFTWPATILTRAGEDAGWSAAFRLKVDPDGAE